MGVSVRRFLVASLLLSPSTVLAANSASSSIPMPPAPDMTPVYSLAGILLSAGVGLFAVRKVIKLMNRS